MSTHADLVAWGEPPSAALEQHLAEFFEEALACLERGAAVDAAVLLRATPQLKPRGEELLEAARLLLRSADSVREHSGPVAGALPDPFPGEFVLRRLVGRGGFGEVWLADDLHLERPVALKTLRAASPSPQALALLRNEARLLASLRHPNLVQVFAWRQAGALHYLVLQYVPGGSLADRVKAKGPLPWHLAVRYVADVAEALLAVHARGVIHRDIKPANLLWDPDRDEALLTDFGVSARLGDPRTVAGTRSYMAPEAFDGDSAPAVDVYGLAASLFWLTTGSEPFAGPGVDALRRQIAAGLPDPEPRCAGLPEPVERLLRAGLSAGASDRPPLAEFAAELRGTLNLLLADTLQGQNADGRQATGAGLTIVVSRQIGQGAFEPVATSQPRPDQVLRDMKKVPPPPRQVGLRSGDRVRVEVQTAEDGFLTVFNVGPTGNLNLLHPSGPALSVPVRALQTLHILDVELTPPAGRERLVALWSRAPLSLRLEEMVSLAERGEAPSSVPYRATRDMVRLKESVRHLPPDDWRACVLELDHH